MLDYKLACENKSILNITITIITVLYKCLFQLSASADISFFLNTQCNCLIALLNISRDDSSIYKGTCHLLHYYRGNTVHI